MTNIAFPLSSHPGENPQESAGRLINVFSQLLGEGSPAPAVWYRAPGIAPYATSAESGFRGMIEIEGVLYVAFANKFLKATAPITPPVALVPVGSGTFSGTAPVFYARNNNTVPDKVVVSENGAHTFTSTTAPVAYGDVDLPQPIDVTFGFGFFFFLIGNSRVYSSDLNSINVLSTSFITAEGRPDRPLRVVFFGDQLYIFSDRSIEVWGTPVNLTGFPLNRITVIPRGIAGQRCITGFYPGFDLGFFIVGNDNKVSFLDGYQPQPVSISEVERDIAAVADKSTIEMSCYYVGGRPCVRVRCPAWTWVFDVQAKQWHERMSYLSTTSRSMDTLYAFDKWLCGDTNSGNLGSIVEGVYTEWGNPLVWRVESIEPPNFPNPVTMRSARFKFSGGVGVASGIDPIQTNPQVQISWSDDGGLHWGYPVLRPLGRQSLATDVVVNRTGMSGSHGRRWRLEVADPVHTALMSGDMDAQARAPAPKSTAA